MADSREEERMLDLKDIMRVPQGRRFIWSILQDTGVFGNTFSPDPYTHAFNAGFRQYGVRLNSELVEEIPAFYDMMVQESRVGVADSN